MYNGNICSVEWDETGTISYIIHRCATTAPREIKSKVVFKEHLNKVWTYRFPGTTGFLGTRVILSPTDFF